MSSRFPSVRNLFPHAEPVKIEAELRDRKGSTDRLKRAKARIHGCVLPGGNMKLKIVLEKGPDGYIIGLLPLMQRLCHTGRNRRGDNRKSERRG